MSNIVYVAPYIPPAPPRDPWSGVRFMWDGADGTRWQMQHPSGIRLRPGTRGLTMPATTDHTSRSAGQHGQRFRSYEVQPRDVLWQLQVFEPEGDIAWLDYDSAWWRSLSHHTAGTWTVTHPNGSTRTLGLRLRSDGDPTWSFRPGEQGFVNYAVSLVADNPFWMGQRIESPVWGQEEVPVNFTGADDIAPPLHVMGASQHHELTNPGDVPASLLWTIKGPMSSASLTVNGNVLGVPFPVLDGQTLTIDTGRPYASLDGEDVTGELVPGFAPVPAGGTVPVGIVMSGTGTVQASFTPRYLRAW